MIRMIKFELKKLFSNSIVIGSIAVLLFVCFFILQACCFNNSATSTVLPDVTQLSGRKAIEYITVYLVGTQIYKQTWGFRSWA